MRAVYSPSPPSEAMVCTAVIGPPPAVRLLQTGWPSLLKWWMSISPVAGARVNRYCPPDVVPVEPKTICGHAGVTTESQTSS
jgi:hypothetical protein